MIYNFFPSALLVGTGKIWLEDPRCANNPWSLSDCNFYGWGHTSCDHSKDLYVVCKNERLAPDYYDFYRDLNPKPCLSYAACSHYSKCVKVVTEGAHQHSMCLHCREGTIGNGKKCTGESVPSTSF